MNERPKRPLFFRPRRRLRGETTNPGLGSSLAGNLFYRDAAPFGFFHLGQR